MITVVATIGGICIGAGATMIGAGWAVGSTPLIIYSVVVTVVGIVTAVAAINWEVQQ
jgi:hypothetical protein